MRKAHSAPKKKTSTLALNPGVRPCRKGLSQGLKYHLTLTEHSFPVYVPRSFLHKTEHTDFWLQNPPRSHHWKPKRQTHSHSCHHFQHSSTQRKLSHQKPQLLLSVTFLNQVDPAENRLPTKSRGVGLAGISAAPPGLSFSDPTQDASLHRVPSLGLSPLN